MGCCECGDDVVLLLCGELLVVGDEFAVVYAYDGGWLLWVAVVRWCCLVCCRW